MGSKPLPSDPPCRAEGILPRPHECGHVSRRGLCRTLVHWCRGTLLSKGPPGTIRFSASRHVGRLGPHSKKHLEARRRPLTQGVRMAGQTIRGLNLQYSRVCLVRGWKCPRWPGKGSSGQPRSRAGLEIHQRINHPLWGLPFPGYNGGWRDHPENLWRGTGNFYAKLALCLEYFSKRGVSGKRKGGCRRPSPLSRKISSSHTGGMAAGDQPLLSASWRGWGPGEVPDLSRSPTVDGHRNRV